MGGHCNDDMGESVFSPTAGYTSSNYSCAASSLAVEVARSEYPDPSISVTIWQHNHHAPF